MRLVIPLCKHCLRKRGGCDRYKLLRPIFRDRYYGIKGTFIHHCQEYYTLIPVGTRVSVELKQIHNYTNYPHMEPPDENAEWVSAGWHKGTVEGKSSMKGFMRIKLDKSVDLMYPDKGRPQPWLDPILIKVDFINKRPKEIGIIGKEAPVDDN